MRAADGTLYYHDRCLRFVGSFVNALDFSFDYERRTFGHSVILQADCHEWLARMPADSIHAVVTDPPYGIKEYEPDQLAKKANGSGGIWRIPPAFDGNVRSPLPRFTALTPKELVQLQEYFAVWSRQVYRVLKPGGHVFLASNAYLSHMVFGAIMQGGFEFRGEIIRLVRTLRGGDRPKNAEDEFSDVCTLPRGCYEPWGLFRKPLPRNMKGSDCLRLHGTGGLRRMPDGKPFNDVILSQRTSKREREIAEHPSLKPQSFLRQLVYAALPLGDGVVLDPFMGSGSTVAAAEALGYASIGIERQQDYFDLATVAIPRLMRLSSIEQSDSSVQQMLLPLD